MLLGVLTIKCFSELPHLIHHHCHYGFTHQLSFPRICQYYFPFPWLNFLLRMFNLFMNTRPYLDVIMKSRTDLWNQYQCLGRRFKNTQSFQKMYIYVYLAPGNCQIKFLPFYGCWNLTDSALSPGPGSTHQMLEDGKFWVNYTCLVDGFSQGIEFRIMDASYKAPGDLCPGV